MVMPRYDVHERVALVTIPLLTVRLSDHLLLFWCCPLKETLFVLSMSDLNSNDPVG